MLGCIIFGMAALFIFLIIAIISDTDVISILKRQLLKIYFYAWYQVYRLKGPRP